MSERNLSNLYMFQKGSLYAQTAIWLHLRIMNPSDLFCTTESQMKRKVPIRAITCTMRYYFNNYQNIIRNIQ